MSLHADAVKVLAGWRPADEHQLALRDLYLAHLRAHPDGLSRACRPGHLTASVAVLDSARLHVLLTLHRKIGRWLQLGGHCEPGDGTLAAAALREATEESGIVGLNLLAVPVSLDRHAAPCGPVGAPAASAAVSAVSAVADPSAPFAAGAEVAPPTGWTWHLDVQFLAISPDGARPVCGDESDDLRWWPVGALPPAADDAVHRLVTRARAATR